MGLFQWFERISENNQRSPIQRPPEDGAPVVRRRFRFTGRVQGVGFRYEACLIAGELSLTGWARNESDGTVTVEAQGPDACVREFVRVMESVPRFRITEIQSEERPVSGEETGFRILY